MIIQSCNHGEFLLIAYESTDLTQRQPCLLINSVTSGAQYGTYGPKLIKRELSEYLNRQCIAFFKTA